MQNIPQGLTSQQAAEQTARGNSNADAGVSTKSIKRIVYENIFTLFNLINFVFAIALVFAESFKNMLFLLVVACNTAIGIIQEIRSKRAVDRLSIIVSKKASVVRDGTLCELEVDRIVVGDVILLKRGSQIPADCELISGDCMVNESLLTGESDLIHKAEGSRLYSGSFISSGECFARVQLVGSECYAAKINSEAKYIKKVNSEILNSLNKILKFISVIIFPLGAILLYRQLTLQGADMSSAIVSVVAALLGMIPDGLVLLTSTVLAVSVIRLSKKGVLVRELYCIESLARVDVLCLDKTGTITTDEMMVEEVLPLDNADETEIRTALASLARASRDNNSTINAVYDYTEGFPFLPALKVFPFSSETKWSGAVLENGSTYIIGAGEFIEKQKYNSYAEKYDSKIGSFRVLSLVKCSQPPSQGKLSGKLSFLAFVLISDKIRDNAPSTITYFKHQGVDIKVISGDNPKSVASIARQVGIDGSENFVDATSLVTDEQIKNAAEKYTVFGRVTPHQKKKLVLALKANGHTVAMTGDGVNDVLALKEADCSVAMAAGSEAARSVSQLVLADNDFSAMPSVVGEGRRTINNIRRSASLFLVKTLYSVALAISFIFITLQYPFVPIQMSLISTFTVGIPSFVLALEPNNERVTGGFLKSIIMGAVPSALTVLLGVYLTLAAGEIFSLSYELVSTITVLLTALTGFMFLIRLSIPFTKIRAALLAFVVSAFVIAVTVFPGLFSIAPLTLRALLIFAVLALITIVVFNLLFKAVRHFDKKPEN